MERLRGAVGGEGTPSFPGSRLKQQAVSSCLWVLTCFLRVLASQAGPCLPLAMGLFGEGVCSRHLPDSRCLSKGLA